VFITRVRRIARRESDRVQDEKKRRSRIKKKQKGKKEREREREKRAGAPHRRPESIGGGEGENVGS